MRNLLLTLVAASFLTSMATANAGTYPIDGLPNYNATYYGSPGTGARYRANVFQYMTLYRDNYNRSSRCAGEGCGKHPGVDISATSGTAVKAALSGKIIRSECHTSFGGLIVIEAANPYRPGEKVYLSYMHLKQRLVLASTPQVPVSVTEGLTIGYSGGAPADVCHGAATGQHLHFQIDKPWGGPYPWFPTGQVETPDNDFEVMKKTYNPIVFVKGLLNWTFDEANFKEWWVPAAVTNSGVINGALWLDGSLGTVSIERGPQVSPCSVPAPAAPCSTEVSIDTAATPNLLMALNFKCVNNPATVSVKRSNATWASYSFSYTSFQPYLISLKNLALADGIITNLRITPSHGCTAKPGPEEYFFTQIDVTH